MSSESIEIGRLYRPIKQIADALVPQAREPFINLPGLRGYWPMSVVDFLGNAKDHSGASSDLARVGAPTFGYDGNAFVQCGVANDYLAGSTSAQTITGTEAWINPGLRGLTIGAWMNLGAIPGTTSGLMSKGGLPPNRGYEITVTTTTPTFRISLNGTLTTAVVATVVLAVGTWEFVAGRFAPGVELAIFVNGHKDVNTTSIPASCFANTQPFEIARYINDNNRIPLLKTRDAFLCQAILTDAQIENLRLASLPG